MVYEVSGVKKGNPNARVPKITGKSSATQRSTRSRNAASLPIPEIVDRYKNAVVNIEVSKKAKKSSRRQSGDAWGYFQEPRDNSAEKNIMNIGTGFFFDTRGYILTNEHVIHDADEIFVRFFDEEEGVPATVIGTSYETDLAVIKVDPPKTLKTLPLGASSDVRVGEWVVAIGCPLGLDHSVTVGIISATERPIVIGDRNYPHLLQTDAAINRGNSGGPLINMRGEVIGMNTAVSASSQGIGFAIPADFLKKSLEELMNSVPKRKAKKTMQRTMRRR